MVCLYSVDNWADETIETPKIFVQIALNNLKRFIVNSSVHNILMGYRI